MTMTRYQTLVALTIGLCAAPLAAQQPVAQRAALDRIVAVVGDQPITRFDLGQRLLQDQQRGVKPPTDSAQRREYELQTLNTMIDEELLLQKAKELKVEVPDNELNTTTDRQIRDVKARFATETEFRAELAKAGLGAPEEYRRMLVDQMRRDETIKRTMQKLREDSKLIPANVTEDEVKEIVLASPKVQALIAGKTVRKVVVVPKKLVNIVTG